MDTFIELEGKNEG